MSFTKRLTKEMADMAKTGASQFSAGPKTDGDLLNWTASVMGPEGTPYAGGVFQLNVVIPPEYPFKPPTVNFITPIFHPNVAADGKICMELLKADSWAPTLTIAEVLKAIVSLLVDPHADEPLNQEAGTLYKTNKAAFDDQARKLTREKASH
eukprot:TRINITY_DN1080_c0_g1_i1.p1 TRINITY_DN1080_c0_g1~~TRINITY_DN1080_c0_g1_i1.p1  ORF type:complete len:152 (+),score=49.79 TRINITY_DN1080_c0_g1_i1:106-561(+)